MPTAEWDMFWRMKMIKRLRNKFIKMAMISVTSVMLLLCIIINTANFISVDRSLSEVLRTIQSNQGSMPMMPAGGKDAPKGDHFGQFGPEAAYTTRFFVLRYNDAGTILQSDIKNISAVTEDDTEKYLEIAVKNGEGFGYTSGYKYLVSHDGDDKWMVIFVDCYREIHSVTVIAILSLVSVAVCIVLVWIAVLFFSRRAIDPVVKASERQKQFITDASHELKTPITVIATSLKVLEMENGKQKWLDKAVSQTEKLTELVNSLVTLSRMDEESTPLKMSDFNISSSISEVAESFVDFAASKGHMLSIDIEPDIVYHGDEYAVRQLVSILLDNAVKYSIKDSEITFSLARSKKGVTITAENKCGGIDDDDIKKLFDRFYRPDKSRNSATGGFGIGLSIARAIVEGHGGQIHAENADGDVIRFVAELR